MSDKDHILSVTKLSRDGGDLICRCPHCGDIITLDSGDFQSVRGEQYRHRINGRSGCGGWLEIASFAQVVRELPEVTDGDKPCLRCDAPPGTQHSSSCPDGVQRLRAGDRAVPQQLSTRYAQALASFLASQGHAIAEGDVTEEELRAEFDQNWREEHPDGVPASAKTGDGGSNDA